VEWMFSKVGRLSECRRLLTAMPHRRPRRVTDRLARGHIAVTRGRRHVELPLGGRNRQQAVVRQPTDHNRVERIVLLKICPSLSAMTLIPRPGRAYPHD